MSPRSPTGICARWSATAAARHSSSSRSTGRSRCSASRHKPTSRARARPSSPPCSTRTANCTSCAARRRTTCSGSASSTTCSPASSRRDPGARRCSAGRAGADSTAMKRAERAVLVALVTAVALGLRLAYVAHSHTEQPLRADAGQYARCAQNLLQHATCSVSTAVPPPPDALRSPGYPAFLAAVRSVAGDHWYEAVRFCQAVLGALCVPLAFWLARTLLRFALAFPA